MALVFKPRVAENSTSTGTGAFALANALVGHQRFGAVCAVSDTVEYMIAADSGEWEEGTGTYSAVNTLTRTTVTNSSSGGAAVTFGAGAKVVLLTPSAARFVPASAAQVRAMASDKAITPDAIASASALVTLTDAATVAVDWSQFAVAEVVLADNRTLGNPSNVAPGTTRYVFVQGSDETARSLVFGSNYQGALPALADITSTKWYLLALIAYSATHIVVTCVRAL